MDLVKKTLMLEVDQWEALAELHPEAPVSVVIRQIISGYIKRRSAERAKKAPEVEVEINV